jgi:hypothetical protein
MYFRAASDEVVVFGVLPREHINTNNGADMP